jgi:hypothetical protein
MTFLGLLFMIFLAKIDELVSTIFLSLGLSFIEKGGSSSSSLANLIFIFLRFIKVCSTFSLSF